MADIAIVYVSIHHQNTKKLLDKIAESFDIDLINVSAASRFDLSKYRAVGFASGIYMAKLHKTLFSFLDKQPQLPQKVFVLYTSGSGSKKYADSFVTRLKKLNLQIIGLYCCKGYDTFGLWKLFGGIAKGHPTQDELNYGKNFIRTTIMPKL